MLFNTLLFLVFFTVVAILYWIIPGRFRWLLLVLASFFFYGVFIPAYTAILAVSVLMNYGLGLWIGRSENDKKRKRLLVWGIIINLGMLGIFKYANELISGFDFNMQKVIMPLGISFFTFTNLSYLIEVKRRRWDPERHLGFFTLFVAFFPKLIQGPIERPQTFMPQVREPRMFDYDRTVSGLRLMLWGFFKKLVIADRLAVAVSGVYDHPQGHSGPSIAIATIFFAIQIYADFSGYIDIARGAGKVLGFDLLKNFNLPYAAKSIKDFWTRWHMTLSNWLRDYIFLPVAYSLSRNLKRDRYFAVRTDHIIYSIAITITFLLCGIWHGVGLTFLSWGALYAVYLMAGHFSEKPKRRFYKRIGVYNVKWVNTGIQVAVTFALVTFAWILFRSATLSDSGYLIQHLFSGWGTVFSGHNLPGIVISPAFSKWELIIIVVTVPMMFIGEYILSKPQWKESITRQCIAVRWAAYYFILILIFLLGKFDNQTFVYFQF